MHLYFIIGVVPPAMRGSVKQVWRHLAGGGTLTSTKPNTPVAPLLQVMQVVKKIGTTQYQERIAKLTLDELSSMPETVPTYRPTGKA
jgi:hypothetical protein